MKLIGVITNSHSGILPDEAEKIGVRVVPVPFYINDECFYEEISIKRNDFFCG